MNRLLRPLIMSMQFLPLDSSRVGKSSTPWQRDSSEPRRSRMPTSGKPPCSHLPLSPIRLAWRRLLDDLTLLPQRLWRHKVVSIIRLAVGGITFTTMVLASFYGYSAWLHQRHAVSTSNVTRIEAITRNLHEPGQRWTPDKLSDYARLPEVHLAYQRVEIGVHIAFETDESIPEIVSLLGVTGAEPELKTENLSWGRGTFQEDPDGVILSRTLFSQIAGNYELTTHATPRLTITVARVAAGTIQSEQCELPIRGILDHDDDRIYAPLALAKRMDRWQTHQSEHPFRVTSRSDYEETPSLDLSLDQEMGRDRISSDSYAEHGAPTAIIYAVTTKDIPPLVRRLQAEGYDVRHQLGKQRQLMQLAVALTVLVLLVIAGSVLNAAFNSGAISWMSLSSKLREIGIKLAHGQTRTDILLAYVTEGVVVGSLASLVGVGIAAGLEPPLRELLGSTLGLSPKFFSLGMLSLPMLWIFAMATAVVIGFNVLGAAIPCWFALRSTPVKLLR